MSKKSYNLSRMMILVLMIGSFINVSALNITRYLKADGTGDGMTWETPTSDLKSVLEISKKIDGVLTVIFEDNAVYYAGGSYSNVILQGRPHGDYYPQETDSKDRPEVRLESLTNSFVTNVNLSPCSITDTSMSFVEVPGITIYAGKTDPFFYKCDFSGNSRAWGASFQNTWPSNVKPYFKDCIFARCNHGVYVNGEVSLAFDNCLFIDNNEGLKIERAGKNIILVNCDLMLNKECALLCRSYSTQIDILNSVFEENTTKDSREYQGSAIFAISPVYVYNSVFNGNSDSAYQPAVTLMSNNGRFVNCNFINNKIAFCFKGDDIRHKEPLFVDCVFFKNDKDFYGSEQFNIQSCAMDRGTGIPELDAEKGIISIDENSLGYRNYRNSKPTVLSHSKLINNGTGQPYGEEDINGMTRVCYGAKDIGAAEYTGGLFYEPEAKTITIDDKKYKLASSTINNKKYYFLALYEDGVSEPFVGGLQDLYLRDTSSYQIVPGAYDVICFYYTDGDKKYCEAYQKVGGSWVLKFYESYSTSSQKPVLKTNPNNPSEIIVTKGTQKSTFKITR